MGHKGTYKPSNTRTNFRPELRLARHRGEVGEGKRRTMRLWNYINI